MVKKKHTNPAKLPKWYGDMFPGSEFTDEQRQFGVAMERYKSQNRKPFPTCREILSVVHSLGYARVQSLT